MYAYNESNDNDFIKKYSLLVEYYLDNSYKLWKEDLEKCTKCGRGFVTLEKLNKHQTSCSELNLDQSNNNLDDNKFEKIENISSEVITYIEEYQLTKETQKKTLEPNLERYR